MIKANVYSAKGIKKGSLKLPDLFDQKINRPLLSQAIRVYRARSHFGLSKVKTRGEVKISTRKIYRQKGTGYARHGAKSAPIFVGGGIAHGPKGMKRTVVLPKKLKRQSLASALSLKAKKDSVVIVDNLKSLKKTKDANILVNKLLKIYTEGKRNRATLVLSDDNKSSGLFFRNLAGVTVLNFKDLNAHDVFYGGLIVLDKDIIEKTKKKAPGKGRPAVKKEKKTQTSRTKTKQK